MSHTGWNLKSDSGMDEEVEFAEDEARCGDRPHAIYIYSRCIDARPGRADLRVRRAELYWREENMPLALADCDEAIRIDPTLVGGYLVRARIRNDTHRKEWAMEDASHALKLDPRLWEMRAIRARIFKDRGRLDEALEEVNAILKGWVFEEIFNLRGLLHEQMGRHELAYRDFAKAVELESSNVGYFRNQERVRRRLNIPEPIPEEWDPAGIDLDSCDICQERRAQDGRPGVIKVVPRIRRESQN